MQCGLCIRMLADDDDDDVGDDQEQNVYVALIPATGWRRLPHQVLKYPLQDLLIINGVVVVVMVVMWWC